MPEFPIARADEYLALLRQRLPDKTYCHCVSVAEHMLSFYDSAGIAQEQAVTAGLLHDLCKAMQAEELRERATAYGIVEGLDTPNLLHGPVAAEECRRELGIEDDDTIDAIRWHTTGRGDWNAVGCALYFADFSEPLRKRPEAAEARAVLHGEGYAAALLYVVDTKSEYVARAHDPHPNALAFRAWVRERFGA